MIKFFVRFIIFLTAFFLIGFVSGLHFLPFIIACIFICAWISVVSFDDVLWWIIAFAVVFGLVHYDTFGLYITCLVGVAFLFDIIYEYTITTSNNNFIVLFAASFGLALLCTILIELIQYHTILINIEVIGVGVVISMGAFFFFRLIIRYAQKFIDLYAHGKDMRCHT